MADAGRILIIPRGDYDANSTYEKLDLVKYKGTSWLAKKTATGVEPSKANAEYWQDVFEPNIANNLTTEAEGYALDARQGKVLNDKITAFGDFKLHEKQILVAITGGTNEVTMTKPLVTGTYLLVIHDASGSNTDHVSPVYILRRQGTLCRADAILPSTRIESITFNDGTPIIKFTGTTYPNVAIYRLV